MLWGPCSSLAGRVLRRPAASVVFVLTVLAGAGQSRAALPEEQLTYQTDARFGRVLAIRNEAAQPTMADVARRTPQTPSPSGPIRNTADLAPVRAERDAVGMTHVRFTQTYRGLPVFGADATVHLETGGRVSSANARLVPDIQVDVQPALTREQAVLMAVGMWQAQFHRTETPEATSTHLCLLAPGLLHHDGNPATHLVWEVKLLLEGKETGRPFSQDTLYLDARSGELRAHITGIQNLTRKIFDGSARPGTDLCSYNRYDATFNYWFGRGEGYPPSGPNPRYLPEASTDADDLYDLLGQVHNYLAVKFGRNGGNGSGGIGDGTKYPLGQTTALVYLNYLSNWQSDCPGAGFFWTGSSVGFCKGTIITDLVGHEYCHSLPFFSHYDGAGKPVGMVYEGESGALNESQSDVWGQLCELHLAGTNPAIAAASPPACPPPWIQSAGKEANMNHHEIHETHEKDGPASHASQRVALIAAAAPSSRSDESTVAVGFSPRLAVARTRVAPRRLNAPTHPTPEYLHFMRRCATPPRSATQPWIEIHGYRHDLAPRGPTF